MKYLNLIFCITAVLSAVNAKSHLLKVEIVDSSEEFVNLLDDDVFIFPLQSVSSLHGIISYSLGNRIAGDRIIASDAKNNMWPTPQNVAVTINYPATGTGAMISYVNINVTQSSTLGRAYVTRGGLGQHFITIIVEAYSTISLNYQAAIYGF